MPICRFVEPLALALDEIVSSVFCIQRGSWQRKNINSSSANRKLNSYKLTNKKRKKTDRVGLESKVFCIWSQKEMVNSVPPRLGKIPYFFCFFIWNLPLLTLMSFTFLLEKHGDTLGGGLRLGVGTEMVRWSSWQLLFPCTSPCPEIPDIFSFMPAGVSPIFSFSSASPWLSLVFISVLDLWSAILCAMFSTPRIRRKPVNKLSSENEHVIDKTQTCTNQQFPQMILLIRLLREKPLLHGLLDGISDLWQHVKEDCW